MLGHRHAVDVSGVRDRFTVHWPELRPLSYACQMSAGLCYAL